jgi:hypothetical protein
MEFFKTCKNIGFFGVKLKTQLKNLDFGLMKFWVFHVSEIPKTTEKSLFWEISAKKILKNADF